MFRSEEEIYLTVIAGTAIILFFVSLVLVLIIKDQNRKKKYENTILITKLEVKEEVMHAISLEIHDNIGQILSLVKLNINSLPLTDVVLISKADSIKLLLSKAIKDLRNLSKKLNTDYLWNNSLTDIIQFELSLIQETGQFNTNFESGGEEKLIEEEKKIIIIRILQEILSNCIKHSNAKTITIALNYLEDKMILSISDDGIGFKPSDIAVKNGTGILNMLHRARLINASLEFLNTSQQGTAIELTINF